MPDDTLEIPVEGTGEDEMTRAASGAGAGDIDDDCLQILLEDAGRGHTIFVEDQAATEEVMGQIVDFASGRKFDEIGPIEAAAAEVIMGMAP
ncbi:MAG: hypothetical protein V3V96_10635 [Acidiferrobacterales bacterium]